MPGHPQQQLGLAGKDPIVTPRSLWDLRQLIGALGLPTLASGLLTGLTMLDLLRLCGCAGTRDCGGFSICS